jgi:hypothetical protein
MPWAWAISANQLSLVNYNKVLDVRGEASSSPLGERSWHNCIRSPGENNYADDFACIGVLGPKLKELVTFPMLLPE